MRTKVFIVEADKGVIKYREIKEGNVEELVKQTILEILDKWDPAKSDLIVMRHEHIIEVPLPLTKEQYEKYSKLGLRRVSQNKARFAVPVYIISYDNEWIGEDVIDNIVRIVTPYVDELVSKEIEELAVITTVSSRESS